VQKVGKKGLTFLALKSNVYDILARGVTIARTVTPPGLFRF